MQLNEALRQLAADSGLDADELIAYAAEDDVGGYERGQGNWPMGSIFADDGRFLYALVRATRPATVLEFGIGAGCASKHLLKALVKNRKGTLYSVEHASGIDRSRYTAAELKRWQRLGGDARTMDFPFGAVDVAFEDTDHTTATTRALAERALDFGARFIVSHDSEHYAIGETVREGLRLGLPWFRSFRLANTDCGLAYWCEREGD